MPAMIRTMLCFTSITLLTFSGKATRAAEPPSVKVLSVRRAFDNGEHNAFTDLCKFEGKYYLTFRSCPEGHMVFPTSSIIIQVSDDAKTWETVHRFSVPKRDVRDPHFLVFGGKLFVYTGTWYCGDSAPKTRTMNEHLGYAAWSEEGQNWHSPVMLEGTYGHYIWRAAAHDGKAYLCGRRIKEFAQPKSRQERDPLVESALLESDDGLIFRKKGLFQETNGDETAFLIERDGRLLAVARSGSGLDAQLCVSKPPYEKWKRSNFDRYIGGPLVVKWGDHYLIGGRKTIGKAVTALYWLVDGQLQEITELPSGGDNSYPGFVPLSDTRGLLSYYSSHEKDENGKTITAIYLAELEFASR